jgi:hypothetical protein
MTKHKQLNKPENINDKKVDHITEVAENTTPKREASGQP